jgi:curved DNA-binding protein CbpA
VERIQDRHQENQALTHYDDLGLPAAASEQEIREAYLNLVRLLHPDQQDTPNLKRFADFQMKRVSRAYAVLADRDRRRRYDAELAQGGGEPDTPGAIQRHAGRWRARALITIGWLICAFAGVVGIGWYVSQQTVASRDGVQLPSIANAAPTMPLDTTRVAAAGPGPQPANPLAADASDKPLDPDPARAEIAAAKTERDHALERTIHQAKELDFLSSLILAAPPRPPVSSSRFSGVWVLPKPKVELLSSAFTPESVDLIVTSQAGRIQGRYRAIYPGMGAVEPPMVRFFFEGTCNNDTANAPWTSDDGSKGEIQLKLTSGNALQLVWSVTDTGNQTGPATGTVALVRKREN